MTIAAPRTVPFLESGDLSAPPGSRPWSLAVRLELQALLHDTESNADRLQRNLQEMRQHSGYRQLVDATGQPYPTYKAFCIDAPPFGLGYDPASLEALAAERKSAQAKAQLPMDLASHGAIGNGRSRHSARMSTTAKYGENDAYTIAVLKRDHPAVLARLQAGEFKTVADAARAAGIKKTYPKITPTPKGFMRAIRKHLSPEQIAELVRLLGAEP